MYYQSVNVGHSRPRWFWPKWFLRDKATSTSPGFCKAQGDSFPSAANADICDRGSSTQVGHILHFRLFSGTKGKWQFKSGQNYAWGWKAELDGRWLARGKGVAEFTAYIYRGAHVITIYGASSGKEQANGPLLSVSPPSSDGFVEASKSTLQWTDASGDAAKCKCVDPGEGWKGRFCGIWGKSSEYSDAKDSGQSWWKPWCYVGPDCKDAKDDTRIEGMKWAYCRRYGPAFTTPDSGNKFPLVYGQSLEYKCWPGYTLDGSQWGRTKLASYVWPGAYLWPPPPTACKQITYYVCGYISDARNNRGIGNIEVEWNGQKKKTWWGWFCFVRVPLGMMKLKVNGGSSYIGSEKEFEVTGNMWWWGPASAKLSPVMAPNQWRAVLTWGRKPYDLDSHTYWGSRKTLWYRRGPNWGYGMGAALEKDDVSSYGPETTFFIGTDSCRGATIHCDMAFKVYDYGRNRMIKTGSEAVVTLYHGSGVAGVFKVADAMDAAISSDNNWWHVFTIDGKTNKLKYSSSPASGAFLQHKYPQVTPMNGTGYDGLGPFPRRKWKRRSQRDPALANVRRAFFQQQRATRSKQVKHNRPLNFTKRQMMMMHRRPARNGGGLNGII